MGYQQVGDPPCPRWGRAGAEVLPDPSSFPVPNALPVLSSCTRAHTWLQCAIHQLGMVWQLHWYLLMISITSERLSVGALRHGFHFCPAWLWQSCVPSEPPHCLKMGVYVLEWLCWGCEGHSSGCCPSSHELILLCLHVRGAVGQVPVLCLVPGDGQISSTDPWAGSPYPCPHQHTLAQGEELGCLPVPRVCLEGSMPAAGGQEEGHGEVLWLRSIMQPCTTPCGPCMLTLCHAGLGGITLTGLWHIFPGMKAVPAAVGELLSAKG